MYRPCAEKIGCIFHNRIFSLEAKISSAHLQDGLLGWIRLAEALDCFTDRFASR